MRRTFVGLLPFALSFTAFSGSIDKDMFAELRWRLIGPFRGGRTVAISGVVQQPNVFYMAPNNGGIWKTTDYAHTWTPIFDGQDTGSVGAIAVAPSDPNVIYVGSGEGLQRPDLSVGDGVYKSEDAGKTWVHLGLRDGYQISSMIVDPHDPNRLFIAVLGHPYGPNKTRGVFRSVDGGHSFDQVLFKEENTGAVQVAFDPVNSQIVYAALWSARQAPWEVGASFNGPGSGLFRSTDGGNSWKQLAGGLPTFAGGLGRIGFAIAPSDSRRMYALVDAQPAYGGLYRSDDAGENWTKVNNEVRIYGRGSDFACVQVDPGNADRLYVANTSTYRSDDGGKTFRAIKGAPGGDDYHSIWISPTNPNIMLLGVDQGATLTVNGGQTWSSWYNQPTAQFYHVITDNRFPYYVYGAQQESGSVGIASCSDEGSISFRDWRPVGVEEYGYVAPDPLHPDIIYGGKATRFNWITGDVQDVSPQPLRGPYRFVRTMPLLFSPIDPHVLFLGSNVIFKTTDGGNNWTTISPDLTRKSWAMPDVIAAFASQDPEKGQHRGVVYTIAPSPKDAAIMWAGTDDGLIHVTRDGGKRWIDVTPHELTPWSKVSLIEASHFDTAEAYAAINRFRLDDLRPHIYRTRDGGKTWTERVAGLPENAVVNAVREDPRERGLLFAATEIGVFVSFDDGDRWSRLQNNLPVTSVRDLAIHENDLVAGTHGRSFWILDDITPLRQIARLSAASRPFLFAPARAIRWRWNRNTDTPLPPEEPAGQNPPDGAILDYWLPAETATVALEIYDSRNALVRRYTSGDKPAATEEDLERELNVPTYWVRPTRILSRAGGVHRFVWDLRYPPPATFAHEYPIAAVYRDTPRVPEGPLVMPGTYTVKLIAGDAASIEHLTVVMDPRVKTPIAGLQRQFDIAFRLSALMREDFEALTNARSLRQQVKATLDSGLPGTVEKTVSDFDARLAMLDGQTGRGSRGSDDLRSINSELAQLYEVIEGSDNAPTTQAVAAAGTLESRLRTQLRVWRGLHTDVIKINQMLSAAGKTPLSIQ